MFCIAFNKEKGIKKNLKIVINLKDSQNIETKEFYSDLNLISSLSDLISHNIEQKNDIFIFKREISLTNKNPSFKQLFLSLVATMFNYNPINYSDENHEILHEISIIFGIQKLKISIERYDTYLDQLSQFLVGRLPLFDEEFLCQQYLLDLTSENIEDTANASRRFIANITADSYCQIFYRCIFCQLSKTALFLDFIVNKLEDFSHHFIKTLMRIYRFNSFSNAIRDYDLPVVCFLLRYFIENGHLKRADEETFNYQVGRRTYTYQFFDFDDGNIHYAGTYYVYRHYEEISRDNYSLHRKLVLKGKNQDPLFQIVENDDLESLQKMIAFDPSKDIDTEIESCYYESRPLFQLRSFSLIEIAAYFGSVKIFKFLLINNAIIRKYYLRKMALYGGNSEIIRLCQQKDISFDIHIRNLYMNCGEYEIDTPILIAIKMHNFQLLRWLIEDIQIDIEYEPLDPIDYALRCSNFIAFYYLLNVKYETHNSNINENSDENDSVNDIEINNFRIDWSEHLISLVLSYNIPILKNYVDIKNKNLLELPKNQTNRESQSFMEILTINYDTDLIDILLKDNKIINLDTIPYENISSLTYQRIGRYFLTNKNVTYTSHFLEELIKDLVDERNYEETPKNKEVTNNVPIYNMKMTHEFIEEQLKLLFDKALRIEDRIYLLPIIFKHNLYENNYNKFYSKILNENNEELIFKSINNSILRAFLKYTNVEILKYLFKRMDNKTKKKYCNSEYILAKVIENNNIESLIFLLTDNESPFSSTFKFDLNSFYDFLYNCTSIEIFTKLVQIYNDKIKECDFYNDILVPDIMFHAFEFNETIIQYLFSLPEIEPFINKENEKYKNLPPLLYSFTFSTSIEWLKLCLSCDKIDINVRQNETNSNILAFISDYDFLALLLSNDKFKYTSEDITRSIENSRYPGLTNSFELLLNDLVSESDEIESNTNSNLKRIKDDFTDEQLSRIFNKICILDDRIELAKLFYSKYSERINVNYVRPSDNSFCLLDAIDCDCCKMVEFLLSIPSIDLSIRATTGSCNTHMGYNSNITPFCYAVVCGVDEIIRLFLKRRNEINVNETFSHEIFFYKELIKLHACISLL